MPGSEAYLSGQAADNPEEMERLLELHIHPREAAQEPQQPQGFNVFPSGPYASQQDLRNPLIPPPSLPYPPRYLSPLAAVFRSGGDKLIRNLKPTIQCVKINNRHKERQLQRAYSMIRSRPSQNIRLEDFPRLSWYQSEGLISWQPVFPWASLLIHPSR